MSTFEARRTVRLFNEHIRECPICDGLENVLCDGGKRLNEEANTASALARMKHAADQGLGEWRRLWK